MRFVQTSDVHLDSALGGALRLPAEKRDALRQDIRSAFEAACALAVDRNADLVLIPGDLFDYECADETTASFLAGLFRSIAPIPVFIAPGNHDSLRPSSLYLEAVKTRGWPENVHVFTSQSFETVVLQDRDCSITGIAHVHRGITERLLAQPLMPGPCRTNLLVFHGSREGWRPADKEAVLPFTDEELLAQQFTYAAIGHYHSFSAIADSDGRIRAAYSGCPQGRGLDEDGAKFVLVGEIGPSGEVDLEKVEVAPRRVIRAQANVSGCRNPEDVMRAVEDAAVSARPQDILIVELVGSLPPGIDVDTAAWEARAPFFFARIDSSRIEPDYEPEAIEADSRAAPIRAEFVRRILRRQEDAESEDEKLILKDAIYYGLRALDGKRVEPRDAR